MRKKAKAIHPGAGWRWQLDGDPVDLTLLIIKSMYISLPLDLHKIIKLAGGNSGNTRDSSMRCVHFQKTLSNPRIGSCTGTEVVTCYT